MKKILIKKEQQNKILNQYLSIASNYVICVDITKLGLYGELFLAIDLAGRTVVGHCFNSKSINTNNICETIQTIVRQRSFLPKIEIIHSDFGSVFNNEDFNNCLKNLNIEQSKGLAQKNQNQVVERLNRTIKDIIRAKILGRKWQKGTERDPLNQLNLKSNEMANIIQKSIEYYNQRPHKVLFGLSPNHMEEALFQKHQDKKPTELTLLWKNDESFTALAMKDYKKQVAKQYKGNWEQFFIDWRLKQEQNHKEVISEIVKAADEARRREAEITEKYNTLYDEHLKIQEKVELLHQQALKVKKEREEKEFLKLKKQQAKKLPLRDVVTAEEFHTIISMVDGKPFVKERKTIALLLLYLTGLRVSNLLLLNIRHVKELYEKGKTQISLIKGGDKRFNLVLSNKGRKLLLDYKDNFVTLCYNKNENDPVFTPINKTDTSMPRENLDRELNKVLKKASEMFQKNIKTHSFRATVITELLANSIMIDDVKEIIGHKAISSTLNYKRSRLSPQEIKKAHNVRNIESKIDKKKKKGRKIKK